LNAQLDGLQQANRNSEKILALLPPLLSLLISDLDGRKIFRRFIWLMDLLGLDTAFHAINERFAEHVKNADYSPAFQYGHRKSFYLPMQYTPIHASRTEIVIFFSRLSGSESVDTALKSGSVRILAFKKACGTKTKFIGRAKGLSMAPVFLASVRRPFQRTAPYTDKGLESYQLFLIHQVPGHWNSSKGNGRTGKSNVLRILLISLRCTMRQTLLAVIGRTYVWFCGRYGPPTRLFYSACVKSVTRTQHSVDLWCKLLRHLVPYGCENWLRSLLGYPRRDRHGKARFTNGVIPMGAVAFKQEIYRHFMDTGGQDYMPRNSSWLIQYPRAPYACAAGLGVN